MTMTFVGKTSVPVPQPEAEKAPGRLRLVARAHGVGPLRQYAQRLDLRFRGSGLSAEEYYDFALYDCPRAARPQFLGAQASRELNLSLSPEGIWDHDAIVTDKVALLHYIAERGLPTARSQATVGKVYQFGGIRRLRTVAQVIGFLAGPARYPLLAKPTFGALGSGFGSGRIERVDGDGRVLHFANGRCSEVPGFAEKIIRGHGKTGLLFQSVVQQHPRLTALAGSPLIALRVVTLADDPRAPAALYALACLPHAAGRMLATVELAEGRLGRLRRGSGPETEWRDSHPGTGRPVVGQALPDWTAARDLACAAHGCCPTAASWAGISR